MTVTSNAVYVAWATASRPDQASELARVDPSTGRVQAISQLGGTFNQALQASGSLWATTSSNAGLTLRRLDLQTLRSTGQWPLGGTANVMLPGHDLAVAGGYLWVAIQDRLLRVSLPTGETSLTVPLAGAASSDVAADASGSVLIVGEANQGGVGAVQRRDPTAGALLASRSMTGIAAPLVRAVTTSDVWVSESTGMMGYVQHLDAVTLTPSPSGSSGCAEHPTPTCIEGTNGITATLGSGSLWITQTAGGAAHNYCASASSGNALGSLQLPQPDQDTIEAIGLGQIYYVHFAAGGDQIAHQPLPPACQQAG